MKKEFYCKRFKCMPVAKRQAMRNLLLYKLKEPVRKAKLLKQVKNCLIRNIKMTKELFETPWMKKVVKRRMKKRLFPYQGITQINWSRI